MFVAPLVGLATGCQLVAGITDIAYVPADGFPAAGDEGLSGSSQMPVDAMVDNTPGPGGDPTVLLDETNGDVSNESGSDATLDSGAEGSDGSEAGLEGSVDAGAQSDRRRPKCSSNMLTPTTAVASTTLSPNVAANAIDGMLATRWESAHLDPQWINVDFGAPVFIGEVDVLWEAACAQNYDLEVSMDGMTWTTIPNGTVTGNTLAGNVSGNSPTPPTDWAKAVVSRPLAAVGRYLRVNGTMRCTIYGYSLWEIRAYGSRNADCAQ